MSADPHVTRPHRDPLAEDWTEADRFYIPVTAPVTRPRRTLKYGDTFMVVDSHADIGASPGGPDGLFHRDTRFLSRLELLVNGLQPLLLGSTLRDDNAVLSADLSNPDLFFDKRLILRKDTVHIVRTLFLWRGVAYQRMRLRNYGDRKVSIRLRLGFAADFADLFEVRGLRRPKRGFVSAKTLHSDRVVLAYRGLDNVLRTTTLTFDPAPTELEIDSASYAIDLMPGEAQSLFLTIGCDRTEERSPVPFLRAIHAARRELRAAAQDVATVETSNSVFNEILCRSMADLRMLVTDTPEGRYPYAGIPWYSTTFGRDGLITALQMLWLDPGLARGVLRRLAAYQAKTDDPRTEAEPGKILHEMRSGEMAALHEIPFGRYYGSVDATPLFVLLAGLYAERTGDDELLRELWPAVEAALRWIDGPGDADGDGFVEYEYRGGRGLINQGWKDSEDAISHADGTLAQGRIALAEVQGYVFAAKRVAARCARRLGHAELAEKLECDADFLAERFNAAFWCPELETYALALDGAKRPCCVRSSNAGQVLFTGIAPPDRARLIAEGLMSPRLFSGWGIRTLASDEVRYNPMSYHNGSVWPHDNALIALGFAHYGLRGPIHRVFQGLFDAAAYMDLRRLPELFCGFRRERNRGPTLYPVACSPQAWASATPFTLLQASLGLQFDPSAGEIRLRNPSLPAFLDEVVLRKLRLGASSIDVKVRRHRGEVAVEVLESQGKIRLSILHER
ncbi:MAG TPA: amylo-alpha-1,6-glucosidase [Xanthobacteraceae bacterium]|nr:amylo-alpha-1,6-glucosidase [Xanthobacteraceae bacterium]